MTRPVVSLPEHLRDEIVAHCLAEAPNEGCGLMAITEGVVTAVYPTRNLDNSPRSYTVPPQDHYAALVDAESHGWQLGGVFHSHPSGPAMMSSIDVDRALEADWIYLVVGLEGEIELSAWRGGAPVDLETA